MPEVGQTIVFRRLSTRTAAKVTGHKKRLYLSHYALWRRFSANFSRNFFNLGATTNEQYPC